MYLINTISLSKPFSRLDNPYSILVFQRRIPILDHCLLIKLPAVFLNIPHYLLFSSKSRVEDQLGPIKIYKPYQALKGLLYFKLISVQIIASVSGDTHSMGFCQGPGYINNSRLSANFL